MKYDMISSLTVLGYSQIIPGSEDDPAQLIKSVFYKLPNDVQEKIEKDCAVIVFAHVYGAHIDKETFKSIMDLKENVDPKDVILINYCRMEYNGLTKQQMQYHIAHEFAHFILGHKYCTNKVIYNEEELKSEKLAEKWGFPKL